MTLRSILSVTSEARTNDLTTLDTVKDELGITTRDNDARLSRLISQASGVAATWCSRAFGSETVVETFFPERPTWTRQRSSFHGCIDALPLRCVPVSSIASILVDGDAVSSDLWRLDADAGLVYALDASGSPNVWFISKSAVVTYTGGYVLLDGLPDGVEAAVISLVKQYWFAGARDPLVKSEDIPGVLRTEFWVGGIGKPGELPPDVVALLAPHRRITVA